MIKYTSADQLTIEKFKTPPFEINLYRYNRLVKLSQIIHGMIAKSSKQKKSRQLEIILKVNLDKKNSLQQGTNSHSEK